MFQKVKQLLIDQFRGLIMLNSFKYIETLSKALLNAQQSRSLALKKTNAVETPK